MQKKVVKVTSPLIPPLDKLTPLLEKIWASRQLTNDGGMLRRLKFELSLFLGVGNISLYANGTLPLMAALRSLVNTRRGGEVVTTPFSFVATSHAVSWLGLTPRFVDVDPATGCMDPVAAENALSDRTVAILPVHVYGNICDTKAFAAISAKYGLPLIYDAAHAFGETVDGMSALAFGDVSTLSFHATKTFSTLEGGAAVCRDSNLLAMMNLQRNFGYNGETTVLLDGFNAKMDEVRAAYGLASLPLFEPARLRRKEVHDAYRVAFRDIPGLRMMDPQPGVRYNYGYFPLFIEEDFPLSRDALYEKLKEDNIFGRRYFYPLISDFPTYSNLAPRPSSLAPVSSLVPCPLSLTNAKRLSATVICLPIHHEMSDSDISRVIDSILCAARKS